MAQERDPRVRLFKEQRLRTWWRMLLAQLTDEFLLHVGHGAQKIESARVMLEPAAEPNGAVWRPIASEDELPAHLRQLANAVGATLGKTLVECRWFQGRIMTSRFLCLHLGARHLRTGAYVAAQLETTGGLVAALQRALAEPIWVGNGGYCRRNRMHRRDQPGRRQDAHRCPPSSLPPLRCGRGASAKGACLFLHTKPELPTPTHR